MFLAILGICETNAMKAYRTCVGPITRFEWLVMLADKLINNPFLGMEEASAAAGAPGPARATPGPAMTTPGSSHA